MNIFRISLPGNRVQNSRLEEKVLDSLYPSPKIDTTAQPPHAGIIFLNWTSTNITVPINTTRVLFSFPHNYGYICSAFGAFHFDNGNIKFDGVLPFQIGALGLINLDTDGTNVNLRYVSFDSATPISPFTMRVRFYVFAERGY